MNQLDLANFREAAESLESDLAQIEKQTAVVRASYLARLGCCPPEPQFTLFDAENASDWRFNCGPAAVCAVTNMSPDDVRPKLLDFESKGYTNPTLMWGILHGLYVRWVNLRPVFQSMWTVNLNDAIGLMRVQWGGPWCAEGRPPAARYRHTHWVAWWKFGSEVFIFDINAMCVGGWLSFGEWHKQLAPWIIRECVPKGDGTFWPSHIVRITGRRN